MAQSFDVDTRHKCANKQCQCLISTALEYCSEYCSDADDIEEVELQCDCKHTGCVLKRKIVAASH